MSICPPKKKLDFVLQKCVARLASLPFLVLDHEWEILVANALAKSCW